MRKGRLRRGAAAAATIAAATLIAPAANALTAAGVSVPAELPAAPQVSNPLPPLSSAVPVATPQPPRSAPAPAPLGGAAPAAPVIGSRFAPAQVTAVAAAPSTSAAGPATAPAGGSGPGSTGPSAAEVRTRHAAQQTRRLRQAVLRMQGCLGSLPQRQHRYLTLRAGIGRGRPMARAAAAQRVGIAQGRARAFERHALRALKQVCGGDGAGGAAGSATGAARTSFVVARAGATGGSGTVQVAPVSAGPQGEHQVLAEQKSHGQSQGGSGEGMSAAPSALPRTTGAIPRPPAGNSPSELWVVAALAALAALAGASLVRRRGRFRFEMTPSAAAVATAAGAVVAGEAAAPSDPSQEIVRDALESLSAGDVERAATLVHPDVRWPDPGNGTIEGREQFEGYWSSRLSTVSVDIEPVSYERRNGELLVEVNEIVRSRATRTMIGEYHAMRRFTFRDGLIAEMKHGRG